MKSSVVILTKNPGYSFKQIITAVLEQQTPWPYEVLVIDSGSADGTVEYCRNLKNLRLHLIQSQEFGHGKTRNLGAALTSGEFIVMLTQDALPANKQWLNNLIIAAEQAPDVAGAFGRHLPYPNGNPFVARNIHALFDRFFNDWPAIFYLSDPQRYQTDKQYKQILHFFSNNNACIRRSLWEKIPFPEVAWGEDQLWGKEIIEAGYGKAYANDAVVYHSHNYNWHQLLRRSFDESRALLKLFGYQLCPRLRDLLINSVRGTVWDYRYLKKDKFSFNKLQWVIRCPFYNFLTQLGYYLGQHHLKLPSFLQNYLSLDKANQRH